MNIINKVISFTKAMAVQIAAGCPMASEEEIQKRAEVCSTCPSLNKEEYKCGKCGCALTFKIPLGTSTCPDGRWKTQDEKKE